jgi:sulfatase maturation enzyme AslB (radical SAM superfamily)
MKEKSSNSVNIVYFTTQCNMACTYCYEDLPNVKPKIMSREELIDVAERTIERENDNEQTLFVLFGGEPTLQWDNVKFFMEYAYSLKKNVHYNMTSNGVRFLEDDFLQDYKNNEFVRKKMLSLDISFDGLSGNSQRIYHDGRETKDDILEVLRRLRDNDIPYRIRTTVNTDNFESIMKEIQHLRQFEPKRLILSFDWNGLTKKYGNVGIVNNTLQIYKNTVNYLWQTNQLSFPVCSWVCETCNGCTVTKSQIFDNTPSGEKTRELTNHSSFDTFERKENAK